MNDFVVDSTVRIRDVKIFSTNHSFLKSLCLKKIKIIKRIKMDNKFMIISL